MHKFLVLSLLFGLVFSSAIKEDRSIIHDDNTNVDWIKYLQEAAEAVKVFLETVARLLPQPEDAGKNITDILKSHNYPCEQHTVNTEDGYILQMFRIPHRRNGNTTNQNKPPVFLMHGLLSSAVDFVNSGPENSLGLILADEGYDVWLGNSRGNMYGRSHIKLNPDKDTSFWDFSWHEQGVYDLPASIDYILTKTGASKLTYIGHSQGTTNFFVMASEKPEYNDKINVAVAMSPVALMQNMSSPLIRFLADNLNAAELLVKTILNIHEIPALDWIPILGEVFCNENAGTQFLCIGFVDLLVGFDTVQLNKTLLPVYLSNTPAGCSANQLIHYGQIIKSGYFRKFDYGVGNVLKYMSLTPPEYKLHAITAPMALYHAEDDFMTAECNVAQLVSKLSNIVDNKLIEDFNHLDFIWAADAKTKVYDEVLKIMKNYT